MALAEEFVALLRCPRSGAPLVEDESRLVSRDAATRCAYPITDEIPDLSADSATELPEEEWKAIMARHPEAPSGAGDSA
jgi:uncharacterized protein YbaR (Trm112 family)